MSEQPRSERALATSNLATNNAHSRALAKGFHRRCVENEQRFDRNIKRLFRGAQRADWLERKILQNIESCLADQVIATWAEPSLLQCAFLAGRTATSEGLDFVVCLLRFQFTRERTQLQNNELNLVISHHAAQRLYQRSGIGGDRVFACLVPVLDRVPDVKRELGRRKGRIPDNKIYLRTDLGVFVLTPDRDNPEALCVLSFIDESRGAQMEDVETLAPGMYIENEARGRGLVRISD